jgi:hypothetical protein
MRSLEQARRLREKPRTTVRPALRPACRETSLLNIEVAPVETPKEKLRRLIRTQARPILAPWRH